MGYRSDVTLVAAFKNKTQRDEVLAVYRMNPDVQNHDLMKDWAETEANGHPVLYFEVSDVKWYEHYEEVQGFEALGDLMQTFNEERNFPYLWYKFIIGEETSDMEEVLNYEDDEHTDLAKVVYDNVEVRRTVSLHFEPMETNT
jgi:hypothetical protein